MIFIETSVFSRQRDAVFTAEGFRALQAELAERPDAGRLVPDGGGVRKVRWPADGAHAKAGKRGGARVICYWAVSADRILLLIAYDKSRQENLSRAQLAAVRALVKSEYG